MTPSSYDRFEQRWFDEMAELEQVDKQRTRDAFVQLVALSGVSMPAEIKKGTPMPEILAGIYKKLTVRSGIDIAAEIGKGVPLSELVERVKQNSARI